MQIRGYLTGDMKFALLLWLEAKAKDHFDYIMLIITKYKEFIYQTFLFGLR
jgi:hypothetical protein